eukprot:Nk52_evm2s462 gene=Nk52_evmTU2s462
MLPSPSIRRRERNVISPSSSMEEESTHNERNKAEKEKEEEESQIAATKAGKNQQPQLSASTSTTEIRSNLQEWLKNQRSMLSDIPSMQTLSASSGGGGLSAPRSMAGTGSVYDTRGKKGEMEQGLNRTRSVVESILEESGSLDGDFLDVEVNGDEDVLAEHAADEFLKYLDLEGIFAFLESAFGFQRDNVRNQCEHLKQLLKTRTCRSDFVRGLSSIYDDLLGLHSNFYRWNASLDLISLDVPGETFYSYFEKSELTPGEVVARVALYLLIWGEMANLRYMPEYVNFVYYIANDYRICLEKELVGEDKGETIRTLKRVQKPHTRGGKQRSRSLSGTRSRSASRKGSDVSVMEEATTKQSVINSLNNIRQRSMALRGSMNNLKRQQSVSTRNFFSPDGLSASPSKSLSRESSLSRVLSQTAVSLVKPAGGQSPKEEDTDISEEDLVFLSDAVKPVYNFIVRQGYVFIGNLSFVKPVDSRDKIDYNDCNEAFWSRQKLASIVLPSGRQLMSLPPSVRYLSLKYVVWKSTFDKTFTEARGWIPIILSYERIFLIHILLFFYIQIPLYAVELYGNGALLFAPLLCFAFSFLKACTQFFVYPHSQWKPDVVRLALLGFGFFSCGIFLLLSFIFLQPSAKEKESSGKKDIALNTLNAVSVLMVGLYITIPRSLWPFEKSKRGFGASLDGSPNRYAMERTIFLFRGLKSKAFWLLLLLFKIYFNKNYVASPCAYTIKLFYYSAKEYDAWNTSSVVLPFIAFSVGGLMFLAFLLETYFLYSLGSFFAGIGKGFSNSVFLYQPWKFPYKYVYDRIFHFLLYTKQSRVEAGLFSITAPVWNMIVSNMYGNSLLTKHECSTLLFLKENIRKANGEQTVGYTKPIAVKEHRNALKTCVFAKNEEVQNRLDHFCSSMCADLPSVPPVRKMRSFSVIGVYKLANIVLSEQDMFEKTGKENSSMLRDLIALYPQEWDSFAKLYLEADVKPKHTGEEEASKGDISFQRKSSEAKSSHELVDELYDPRKLETASEKDRLYARLWASCKTETLYRSIRGVMLYVESLKELIYTERPQLGSIFADDKAYNAYVDQLVHERFSYVLAIKQYDSLPECDLRSLDRIFKLWPELQICYQIVEEQEKEDGARDVHYKPGDLEEDVPSNRYYACLIDGYCPKDENTLKRIPKLKIELPGNPFLGDIYSDNINQALTFCYGEIVQACRSNQVSYIEESVKLRSILEQFESFNERVCSVSVKSTVYSSTLGWLAQWAALEEECTSSLANRVINDPLGAYFKSGGVGNFLDKILFLTRGGVERGSLGMNLNNKDHVDLDIMSRAVGVNVHAEFFQLGVGRSIALKPYLNDLKADVRGACDMLCSRQNRRCGEYLPFHDLMTLYFAQTGKYIMWSMLMWFTELSVVVYFAIASVSAATSGFCTANNEECTELSLATMVPIVEIIETIFFWGVFTPLVVIFGQLFLEKGLVRALLTTVKQMLCLVPLLSLFRMSYASEQMSFSLACVKGPKFTTSRRYRFFRQKFSSIYSSYCTVFYFWVRVFLCAMFAYVATGELLVFVILSVLVIAEPFIMNPHAFQRDAVVADYKAWMRWMFQKSNVQESWRQFQRRLFLEKAKGGPNVAPKYGLGKVFLVMEKLFVFVWNVSIVMCLLLFDMWIPNTGPEGLDDAATFPGSCYAWLVGEALLGTTGIPFVVSFALIVAVTFLGYDQSVFGNRFVPLVTFGMIPLVLAVSMTIFDKECGRLEHNFDVSTAFCKLSLVMILLSNALFDFSSCLISQNVSKTKTGDYVSIGSQKKTDWIEEDFHGFVASFYELSVFQLDFLLGNAIFSLTFLISLIPKVDQAHTFFLLWKADKKGSWDLFVNKTKRKE